MMGLAAWWTRSFCANQLQARERLPTALLHPRSALRGSSVAGGAAEHAHVQRLAGWQGGLLP